MDIFSKIANDIELGIVLPSDLTNHPLKGTEFTKVGGKIQQIILSGQAPSKGDIDNLISSTNNDLLSGLPESYTSDRGRIKAYDLIQGELFENTLDLSQINIRNLNYDGPLYEEPLYGTILRFIESLDISLIKEDTPESDQIVKEFRLKLTEEIKILNEEDNLKTYLLLLNKLTTNIFLAKIINFRKKIMLSKEL